MISVQQLESLKDDVLLPDSVRRVAAALIAAINDWPTDLETLEDFMFELRQEVGVLSKANILRKSRTYSIQTDAWKCEALSELLLAWATGDENAVLDDLVMCVSKRQ